ncbi:MAG: response regulator, partial [Cyclobacteriaceae bacterium]
RLSQILINLLNNAIKFTNEGTVELNCASQPLSDSKTLVTLTIKDSGLGMSADQIRRIFDRFSQAQADTTRKYGGTGLGLNIVKKLVDLHNGSLEVVSTPGKGSEFIINLPFVLTDDYAVLQTNVDKGSQSLVLDPTLRILVVEDNPINQELAKTVLEGFGSQVEVADNGVKCIELLQKHKYDLILMDIQMPEMDGYETTKTIREVFSLEVPIIAMTANVLSSEIDKCIISGMNDYLSKPFKTIDLYNIIKKHSPESKKNYSIPDSKSSHQKNTSEEVLNSGSTIDLTYIKEMSNGRPEFAKDMIKLFLNNVPSQLDLMKKAIQNRDYLQIKNLAHSLKSNMNYYGLHTARSWLIDIEQLAVEEGSILLIKKTYKLIASNIQEASRCLQQELDILDEVIV